MRELCCSGLGLGHEPCLLEVLSASTNLALELNEKRIEILCQDNHLVVDDLKYYYLSHPDPSHI